MSTSRVGSGNPAGIEPKRLQLSVEIPEAFEDFFSPSRYKVAHGGRGSAKSWTFAAMLVLRAYAEPLRILCAREFQTSIGDSVHRLLCDTIERMGLSKYFSITQNSIKSKAGAEFIFKGLRINPMEVKSLEGIDICWVEEAQRVSKESWEILIPTIRKKLAEIWVTFNPDSADDPTYQLFVANEREDAIVRKINFDANPFFDDSPLKAEMEFCKRIDFEAYLHIWEGNPKTVSDAVIFKNRYSVEAFDTPSKVDRFFYGADWGFSQDPTVLIRCFIVGRTLYIDQEVYGVEVELDEIPGFFAAVPDSNRWPILADSSRPETISKVAQAGFNIRRATKWPGSVEDGIAYLKGFEKIVIHQRCKHVAEEFKLYSFKVDKKTGDVLPIVVDKHNHCIDALRYALDGYITKKEAARVANYQFMGT